MVRLDTLLAAKKALLPWVVETPLVLSKRLTREFGFSVLLKLETLQPTASFKVRPAFYGILNNFEKAKTQGVIATSSGNFAQAVAYAGYCLGVNTTIVMTPQTSQSKIDKTRFWGTLAHSKPLSANNRSRGEVVFCGPTFSSRFETVDRLLAERGGGLVLHGFDSQETIAANGGVGLEILEQLRVHDLGLAEGIDCLKVYVPTSGGGLASGVSLALQSGQGQFVKNTQVIACQPEVGGSLARSLTLGAHTQVPDFQTAADALVATQVGERAFGYCLAAYQKGAFSSVLLSEKVLTEARQEIFDQDRLWVEVGSASALAALRFQVQQAPGQFNQNTVVVLVFTGANS